MDSQIEHDLRILKELENFLETKKDLLEDAEIFLNMLFEGGCKGKTIAHAEEACTNLREVVENSEKTISKLKAKLASLGHNFSEAN